MVSFLYKSLFFIYLFLISFPFLSYSQGFKLGLKYVMFFVLERLNNHEFIQKKKKNKKCCYYRLLFNKWLNFVLHIKPTLWCVLHSLYVL